MIFVGVARRIAIPAAEAKSERIEVRPAPSMKNLPQRAASFAHKNVAAFPGSDAQDAQIAQRGEVPVMRDERIGTNGESTRCLNCIR
jgi:hypothetical protein